MVRALSANDLVYGLKQAVEPQVSPAGSQVLYSLVGAVAETGKGTSQLWSCGVDGSAARRLTWGEARDWSGRWSPDGAQIAFLSDRAGKRRQGIYVLPAAGGGEARLLTSHQQAINDLVWSPDGSMLVYTTLVDPENPDETPPAEDAVPKVRVTRRVDYKQDNRGYLNDQRQQVFVVAVETGARRQVTSALVDHQFPQWSPDGRWLAAQIATRNGLCSQLGLIAVANGATTLIGPETGAIGTWAWSPAGDRIIFTGDPARTPQHDFFVYEVASGTTRRLTTELAVHPVAGAPGWNPPSQPIWLDDHQVLFHNIQAGGSGLAVIDAEGGTLEPVQRWQAVGLGGSVDRERRRFVQARSTPSEVGQLVTYDLQTGQTRVIVEPNAAVLREHLPAAWEGFTVSVEEFSVEAWLLKPPDFDPSKRYPLILDVHGGPASFYGYSFSPLQQCLATHGFLVLYANPRGSTTYGRHHALGVYGDWGGGDYRDLMAVVDAALTRPYVDSERLGIFGYSYGGYMTAWTISQTDRFKAAVCGAPVFDMESKWGTSDIGYLGNASQWGGAPWENRAFYEARSPSHFVHQVKTPTLIVQGEADERCPVGQGEQMFMSLLQLGCPVEFARYPGGYHGFPGSGPPPHRADFLERTLGWFRRYLS